MDIDFVIPWVDGSDPAWLEEKQKYESAEDLIFGSKNRYRDWDLLRYLFRGIETFAPWVRQVFFVTWGHIPASSQAGRFSEKQLSGSLGRGRAVY